MRRREFVALVGGGAASFSIPVRAQRRPVIAILDPGLPQQFAAFLRAMEELGYRDGKTVSYIRSVSSQSELARQSGKGAVVLSRPKAEAILSLTYQATVGSGSDIPLHACSARS